jgi:serine/threonine protein kinase
LHKILELSYNDEKCRFKLFHSQSITNIIGNRWKFKSQTKKKPLGSGGYSYVFAGTYKDQVVAVKRILLLDAANDNEVKVMQQILDHPNIVKLLHVEKNEDFRSV